MFMQNLPSWDASDLAVIKALSLKYSNHHIDGEMTANPLSHSFFIPVGNKI